MERDRSASSGRPTSTRKAEGGDCPIDRLHPNKGGGGGGGGGDDDDDDDGGSGGDDLFVLFVVQWWLAELDG